MTIASATWDVAWYIPAGRTLGLDPSYHLQGIVSHPDVGSWCESAGSPGSLGAGCRYVHYDLDPSSPLGFFDISSTGTRLRDLEATAGIALVPAAGFTMPFFDDTATSVWANSNGWISFSATDPGGPTATAPTATGLPRTGTTPAGPLVAAFWDDLLCAPDTQDCAFYYERVYAGPEEALILQWDGYSRGTSAGSLTVQAQLWSNGDIVIAFDEVTTDAAVGSTAWKYYRGSNAWIGLEAADRSYVTAHHRGDQAFHGRTYHFIRKSRRAPSNEKGHPSTAGDALFLFLRNSRHVSACPQANNAAYCSSRKPTRTRSPSTSTGRLTSLPSSVSQRVMVASSAASTFSLPMAR
jgi:hypothetical protein